MKEAILWIATAVLLVILLAVETFAATLTWTDNANNEAGFSVKRKLTQYQPGTSTVANAGAFGQLIQLSQVDQVTYVDASAVADINYDNEYCYMVTAWNLTAAAVVQESGNSNVDCLLIPSPAPPVVVPLAPSGLDVVP
jgi:hypothetical protein